MTLCMRNVFHRSIFGCKYTLAWWHDTKLHQDKIECVNENSIHQKPSEGRNVRQTKYCTQFFFSLFLLIFLSMALSSAVIDASFEKEEKKYQVISIMFQHFNSRYPVCMCKNGIGMKSTLVLARTTIEEKSGSVTCIL